MNTTHNYALTDQSSSDAYDFVHMLEGMQFNLRTGVKYSEIVRQRIMLADRHNFHENITDPYIY